MVATRATLPQALFPRRVEGAADGRGSASAVERRQSETLTRACLSWARRLAGNAAAAYDSRSNSMLARRLRVTGMATALPGGVLSGAFLAVAGGGPPACHFRVGGLAAAGRHAHRRRARGRRARHRAGRFPRRQREPRGRDRRDPGPATGRRAPAAVVAGGVPAAVGPRRARSQQAKSAVGGPSGRLIAACPGRDRLRPGEPPVSSAPRHRDSSCARAPMPARSRPFPAPVNRLCWKVSPAHVDSVWRPRRRHLPHRPRAY